MNTLKAEIQQFFKGDIEDDAATLSQYSRDYSIFSIRPALVVFPKNIDDLKNLILFAERSKTEGRPISLTGRSGGTDMTGGPLNDSVIVEFDRYFNHIAEVGANYARIEPGVFFRDFERALGERGLLYPPYPASKDICAIGGMIANNSGGEKSLAYGKTEDYVEELMVVLRDGGAYILKPLSKLELDEKMRQANFEGEIYRRMFALVEKNREAVARARPDVSKNSAGYALWNVWDGTTFNLAKLFVGSQGTLGFITNVKLRLVPAKKHSRLAVIFLYDLGRLADLVVDILQFKPESLESYDDKTFRVALHFFPEVIRMMKGNALKLAWQFLPEFWMLLRGVPRMIILAEFASDSESELAQVLARFKTEMAKNKVRMRVLESREEAEKYLTIRHESFKLLHNHTKGKATAPFIDDVIVQPKYLPEFLPRLSAILKRYEKYLVYTVAGHPGDGNFHVIPLMDLKNKNTRAIIPKLSEEVYKLVLEYKGSITAEHNDGLIRTPYLEKMYGKEIYDLFREVKNIFDPDGIFNPGKKVGGDMQSMLEHIAE